jgi:lipoprotein-releasing system permease protein
MFHPLQLFIGLRYTRAKRRNHFISFISLVSMLGIAVGVMALIAVMSVMNGFQGDMQERILGMVAHASIESVDGGIADWRDTVSKVEASPHVVGAAPYLDAQAMLRGRRTSPAIVHGIVAGQEPKVSNVGDKLLQGSLAELKPGSFKVILGNELAMQLGVRVGDKITVYVAELSVTPVGAVPRAKNCEVVGVFSVGFAEYDTGVALMNLDDTITLVRADGAGGIRLKLDDMFDAYKIAVGLRDHLGQYFKITTWEQSHQNFFSAVKMEKTVMFIILSLIVGVAAFNLVSTLIMLVTDKQADIAILRTLGISPNKVMGIFTVQGVIVGSFGILIGLVGGVLLAWNIPVVAKWLERTFNFEILPADIYYINEVPSDLHWSDVGWVAAIAWVFCLLATLYPAWRAARTQPAAALRYE